MQSSHSETVFETKCLFAKSLATAPDSFESRYCDKYGKSTDSPFASLEKIIPASFLFKGVIKRSSKSSSLSFE